MDLVVYTQYYRTRTADHQLEIDECLRRNLNHPGISKVVLFKEADAPPLPKASVQLEVVESNERITYAEWFRWVKRQGSGIGLLLNADIYLDEGLEHLKANFNTQKAFLALTRYNPGHAGFHLNDCPQWTQDVWGVRGDAQLPESLLYASSFPLGFPRCNNRSAYRSSNFHQQGSTASSGDITSIRLYSGVFYLHPRLAQDDDPKLCFKLWARSVQRPAVVELLNQQAIGKGVYKLRHARAEAAQRFLDRKQITRMRSMHEEVDWANLMVCLHQATSKKNACRPLPALLKSGVVATAASAQETERAHIKSALFYANCELNQTLARDQAPRVISMRTHKRAYFWKSKQNNVAQQNKKLKKRLLADEESSLKPNETCAHYLFKRTTRSALLRRLILAYLSDYPRKGMPTLASSHTILKIQAYAPGAFKCTMKRLLARASNKINVFHLEEEPILETITDKACNKTQALTLAAGYIGHQRSATSYE